MEAGQHVKSWIGIVKPLAALASGIRGLLERILMLYLICFDAAARMPAVPEGAAFRQRLQHYFEGAERYPRQLREVGIQAYPALKRPLTAVVTVNRDQP